MKDKSVLLQIIFWCEMIIAARILVFTMPVLIGSYTGTSLSLAGIEGLSVMALTLIALYYFMTGLASIMGFRGWRLFHYLGTVLTLVLVFSLVKNALEISASAPVSYYIPVIISVALSLFVTLTKETNQRSA